MNDFFLNNLVPLTGIVGGLFAVFKWIDTRKRQLKNERYDKYTKLIKTISGSKANKDEIITFTEQIASAWLLLEYKEYYNLTLKIFENTSLEEMGNENWNKFVLPEIKRVIEEIKN